MFAAVTLAATPCLGPLREGGGRVMDALGGALAGPSSTSPWGRSHSRGNLLGLTVLVTIVFPSFVPGGLTGVARPMIVEGAKMVWWIAVNWATKFAAGSIVPRGEISVELAIERVAGDVLDSGQVASG